MSTTLPWPCGIVCPNRWLVRLALQTLVIVGALSAGAATVPVAGVLLACDPDLEVVRQGNLALLALVALLFLAGIYWARRRRGAARRALSAPPTGAG